MLEYKSALPQQVGYHCMHSPYIGKQSIWSLFFLWISNFAFLKIWICMFISFYNLVQNFRDIFYNSCILCSPKSMLARIVQCEWIRGMCTWTSLGGGRREALPPPTRRGGWMRRTWIYYTCHFVRIYVNYEHSNNKQNMCVNDFLTRLY